MSKFICLNGQFLKEEDANISIHNRAFCFGDGMFETIRCRYGSPLNIEAHFERLTKGMTLLNIDPFKQHSVSYFNSLIEKLLRKNKFLKAARIRLTIYRDSTGLYTPNSNQAGFVIYSMFLPNADFTLNETGLRLGAFKDLHKHIDKLNAVKSLNAQLYIQASIYKKKNQFDEVLIFNANSLIAEASSSNLFLVKDDFIYTPALTSGCLPGTMRKKIIELCELNSIRIKEVDGLKESHLLQADEIFITNAIQGIQWVKAFQERRYYHEMAGKLLRLLNKEIQS